MTRAGIVFSILNVLVALLFVVFTAPIAKYRQDMHAAIEKDRKQVPEIKKVIAGLDKLRVQLPEDIRRVMSNQTFEETMGLNRKDELDGKIALLTDGLNDAQQKIKAWSQNLESVKAEVASRTAEINQLKQRLAAGDEVVKQRNAQIADLSSRLDRTRSDLNQALRGAMDKHQKLLTLERELGAENPTRGVARFE